jgi:hypothetical protein
MHRLGMAFDLRECFFFDRRDDHIDSLASRRFQDKKRKPPISSNETVPT